MTSNSSVHITIQPFDERHVKKTYEWVCNPELRRLFLMQDGIPLCEKHAIYCADRMRDETQRVFAVYAGDDHVGNCGIKSISPVNNIGELWIYIGDFGFHNKGIGKKASQLLIAFCFDTLGLKTVYLHVADFNVAARSLYESLGFRIVADIYSAPGVWNNRPYTVLCMERKQDL